MNKRKFTISIWAIGIFFFGYFYEYMSPYFLNMNFCFGVMCAAFAIITMYCFHLKEKLREARREYGNYYELQNSINKISQQLNKKTNTYE